MAQFVLKLVYAILYFTVGQVLYKTLLSIFRVLFLSSNKKTKKEKKVKGKKRSKMTRKEKKQAKKLAIKEKKQYQKDEKKRIQKEKKPILGALAGFTKGAVSAFVTMIMLGGVLNMMGGILQLIPVSDGGVTTVLIEPIYMSTSSYLEPPRALPLAAGDPDALLTPELEAQVIESRRMVQAFNENIFVQNASLILVTSPDEYSEPVELHLYLFDSVLSFQFDGEKILLRKEINIISEAGGVMLNSDFIETNDISDITSVEIIAMFNAVAESDLITSLIPLGIELGSDYFDMPVDIPVDELYDIDWKAELMTLGAVVAVGFDLINTAGILDEDVDMQTVTLDGGDVRDLFDSLADSELVTLAAYLALEPLLTEMGGELSAIITVPVDLEWAEEFRAFGEVAEAVLDTDITIGDLEGGDPNILISALAEMDFTILLSSEIVSHALKNIFSGEAGIEGLDMIVVPDDLVWFDIFDDDGILVTPGELRNILLAVNAINTVASGFDFDNLDFNIIADFDDPTIDTIFNSELLVATISGFLLDMDLGDTPLVIPDSILDLNGYIESDELKAIASSARVLVADLACDDGDTACEETGFDIANAFGLSDASIDTLTSSEILAATIGQLIVDSGGDILVIPNRALEAILVDATLVDIIKKEEIKNLFKAVSVLGFDDLDNMEFDASIITSLGTEADSTILDTDKSDKLFGSFIVHATLSEMLFDLTSGVDSVLSVPYYDVDSLEIREYNVTDEIDYVSLEELEHILQALLTLDITDFTEIEALDLDLIIDHSLVLLDSAILHATISKQVFDLGGDILSVPYKDQDDNDIRITVGVALNETDTEYIAKSEITSVLDALAVLEITDISSFDGSVDLASITSEPGNIDILLSSAILHATVSEQLINLDTDGTLSIPHKEEDNITAVRVTVGDPGFETEYITKDEINSVIDALDILGIDDIDSFDGSVDLASITSEPGNMDIILSSAILHATVSDQLIKLDLDGTILVPYEEEDNATAVRVTIGDVGEETEYITKVEINAAIDALDILGILDIDSFDGNVDLASITAEPGNMDIILNSAILHATISKQLIDLDTDGTIVIPHVEEDDVTLVRITVGDAGFQTEYITKIEINAAIDALDVLDILDVESFDGSVDLSLLTVGNNKTVVLASAILQATISEQLIDLADAGTVELPFFKEDNLTRVRFVVGSGANTTEYVLKSELEAMIDAMDILDITDIESFDGSVNLAVLGQGTNSETVLLSSMIQATVSKQVLDLVANPGMTATFVVPFFAADNTTDIRISVGVALDSTDTEYILADELSAMIDGLNILGITDVETFDGSIDLTDFFVEANRDVLLGSAIMHATISKQLIDLGAGTLTIPVQDVDTVAIRVIVGVALETTEYVSKNEIGAMFEALEVLGIDDINNFTGAIDLNNVYGDINQDILLSSASIHATITKQMVDLGAGILMIPDQDVDGIDVNTTVLGFAFIKKIEIKAMINALEVLGIDDINNFNGTIDLSNVYGNANQTIILSSAAIHATITKQMFDLGSAVLFIPDTDVDNVPIKLTVSGFEFLVKGEIKAMINALEVLGIDDINGFDGAFDLTSLSTDPAQTILLSSASIHATITETMLDLGGSVLIVPAYSQAGEAPGNEVKLTVSGFEFVVKDEIKALINAFNSMGYSDLASFGAGIDSSKFFSGRAILLSSSSIQATLSDKMLNDTGGELVVPDSNVNNLALIRLVHTDVTYIELTEMNAILDALDELGLTDFGSMSFSPANVFSVDFNLLLVSASIQATISGNILPNALDETAPTGSATIIVPTFFRETILVDGVSNKHIEIVELKALLGALDELGVSDFGGGMSSGAITGMTDAQLATMLVSGSVHTTIDNMMRGNANINTKIPDLAEEDTLYKLAIVTKIEIRAFIKATKTITTGSFTTVSFDPGAVASLTPAEQSDVADSMIVRNILTPTLETACAAVAYPLLPTDYEEDDVNNFLRKVQLLAIINALY